MYRSLRDSLEDLKRQGHLVEVREEVDPHLVMAEVHRRVFEAGGLLYGSVRSRVVHFQLLPMFMGVKRESAFYSGIPWRALKNLSG